MSWDNVEDAFKELDVEQYDVFSGSLATYFQSLQKQGFTRREAFRLIEGYSKFVYDMAFEEYVAEENQKVLEAEMAAEEEEEDEDVDPEE